MPDKSKISKTELIQIALAVAEQLPKLLSNPIIKTVLEKSGLNDKLRQLQSLTKDDIAEVVDEPSPSATPPDRVINTDADLRYVLGHIKFRNTALDFKWEYEMRPHYGQSNSPLSSLHPEQDGWEIRATFERPDTHTGRPGRGAGRWLPVFRGTTETGVFFSVVVLVKLLIEHEFMEGIELLRSDGKYVRPLYPHTSVHQLMSIQHADPNFVD